MASITQSDRGMDMVVQFGRTMVTGMKVTGRKEREREMGGSNGVMRTTIQVATSRISEMDGDFEFGVMGLGMKEGGRQISDMAKVGSITKMAVCTRVSSSTDFGMDLARSCGREVLHMKVCGLTIIWKVKES